MAQFEKFKAELREKVTKHVEERMASMKCPLQAALDAHAVEFKELDQRLRALEERTVVTSSRGKMRSHLRRWL